MSLERFIEKFGEYPTWKKVLMFLPLIAAVLLLFFVRARGGESEQFLKWNKKNNDKKVEDFKVELKRAEKEIAEIEDEEERVRERIKNEEAYYHSVNDRIDNASDDELRGIADELRERVKSNRD